MSANTSPTGVRIVTTGGPTALLTYGGLQLLIDATFDAPGEYDRGRGYKLIKTHGPALGAADLGRVDAVLLSHDQHPDNFDISGRALASGVPVVWTTRSAVLRLGGNARGIPPWSSVLVPRPDGSVAMLTATPALHGPPGCEAVMGEVTGFLLTADDLPTVYISGDNASLEIIEAVSKYSATVDLAILFAGAAQTPAMGGCNLTVDSGQAAEAARMLDARRVVPVHYDGWSHFTEGVEDLRRAFREAGLSDRLVLHPHGQSFGG